MAPLAASGAADCLRLQPSPRYVHTTTTITTITTLNKHESRFKPNTTPLGKALYQAQMLTLLSRALRVFGALHFDVAFIMSFIGGGFGGQLAFIMFFIGGSFGGQLLCLKPGGNVDGWCG